MAARSSGAIYDRPVALQDNLEVLGEDKKLADVIADFINPERFPWMKHGKSPTGAELKSAVEATAELWALQRFATAKRNAAAVRQE